MSSTVTVSLGTLVDQTLEEVQSYQEIGNAVVRPEALSPSDVNCTLVPHSNVNVSDVIEFGTELVLVTAKTDDATPTFTLSRGYYTTVAQEQPAGQAGCVNPQWNRKRVASGVRRALGRMEALGLQLVETELLAPVDAVDTRRMVLEVPSETRTVLSVKHGLYEIPNWEFMDNMDTALYPSGKVIRLPRGVHASEEFQVTYRIPYRWTSWPDEPGELDEIVLPEGAEFLPSRHASCFLLSNREISRSEIDRVSEWQQGEPQRGGVSGATLRALWQDFYRELDEVRRLNSVPNRRPLIRRPARGSY